MKKGEFRKEWVWHVIFWLGYLLIKILVVEYFREDFGTVLLVELISLPLKMFLVYVLIYFLIPRFLLHKKYVQFMIWLVLLVFCAALVRRLTDIYVVYPIAMLYFDQAILWDVGTAFRNLVYVYPVVGLATAIYLMSHWIRDYQIKNELQREKLVSELKYLKAQVHPHFLFNTINNIYSLSLDHSSRTSQSLLELSDLLSYMLYECNVDRIPLIKEIELIENYINLENLRYSERLDLRFNVSLNNRHVKIAPLIMLPFVDNCFKHGAGDSIAECFVHIDLKESEGVLELLLVNSIDHSVTKLVENSGIGLANAQRRLEGEYPDGFDLELQKNTDTYQVKLTIQLDEKN